MIMLTGDEEQIINCILFVYNIDAICRYIHIVAMFIVFIITLSKGFVEFFLINIITITNYYDIVRATGCSVPKPN